MNHIIYSIFFFIILFACKEDYPPCSPEEPGKWGPDREPTTGAASSGTGDFLDPAPRYSTNSDGEVCECGPYELGCVDTPEKARASTRPGAYCPYPREDGDPVHQDPFSPGIIVPPEPGEIVCVCSVLLFDDCLGTRTVSMRLPGTDVDSCTRTFFEVLRLKELAYVANSVTCTEDL